MFKQITSLFLISVVALTVANPAHRHKKHHHSQHNVCERITESICEGVGYNYTKVPLHDTRFQSQKDMTDAIRYLELDSIIEKSYVNCSKNLQLYLCSLYLPMCTDFEGHYEIISPCKSTCKLAKHKCKPFLSPLVDEANYHAWKDLFDCDVYPDKSMNQLCLENIEEKLYLSSS